MRRWRTGSSCARRCSITGSSRRCWRCRRAQRFTTPPKRFLATLAPELERLGAFARKKRGFNPPLDGWLKDDLRERLPAAAQSLARLTGGQLDGARVQAMIDAYATRRRLPSRCCRS